MAIKSIGLNSVNMTFPKYSTDLIDHNDFDDLQLVLEDIMGLGENGYGITSIQSNPVAQGRSIKATQWNYLLADTNSVYQHVNNVFTSTQAVTTGTTVIDHSLANELSGTISNLQTLRYTVHPGQFLISDGGSSTVFYGGGDSLRTLPWGISTNIITHEISTQFPNRLAARYYFNQGCYLTYTPYYQGTGLNDLDAEWANFIDYLRSPSQAYTYGRQQFITYDSTTTEWSSGTLHVSITADRATAQDAVNFTIDYRNDASPNLLISPAVGIYTITL